MNTSQIVAAYHLTNHMAEHDHPYPDLKIHTDHAGGVVTSAWK